MNSQRQHRIVAITLASLCVSGCGPLSTDPASPVKPVAPVESIEPAAAKSLATYHAKLAEAFVDLADEIEAGKIEDDEDLADRMEELTKTARLGSFEAFRQAWAKQAELSEEWDTKERAERCRETAKGFSR